MPSSLPDLAPVLVIDTREPVLSPWEAFFTVPTIRGTLPTGDYSLLACEDWIAIERKSLDDLVSCLSQNRERFEREMQRAARVGEFYVIVEAMYSQILRGQYRSQMTPHAAWESVLAFQHRYKIPFLFAGDQQVAARLAESILLRWWTEHLKVVNAVRVASQPHSERSQ